MAELKRSDTDSPSKLDTKLNLAIKRLINKNIIIRGEVWQGQGDEKTPTT